MKLIRVYAVETDFILHDPIEWWNATSGRVLEFPHRKRARELAFHLQQLNKSD